jgi:hypothetical protein
MTGALHEDGLADCADGFWGGHDAARRLEIMKDSRIGATASRADPRHRSEMAGACGADRRRRALGAVLVPAMLSRGAMAGSWPPCPSRGRTAWPAMWSPVQIHGRRAIRHRGIGAARRDGGQRGGHGGRRRQALSVSHLARLARAKIGGQTGDVLGATQQLAELAALLALTAGLGRLAGPDAVDGLTGGVAALVVGAFAGGVVPGHLLADGRTGKRGAHGPGRVGVERIRQKQPGTGTDHDTGKFFWSCCVMVWHPASEKRSQAQHCGTNECHT